MKKIFILLFIINACSNAFSQTQSTHIKKYDDYGRLVKSIDSYNTIIYSYDKVGNRTQVSISTDHSGNNIPIGLNEISKDDSWSLVADRSSSGLILITSTKEVLSYAMYDVQGKKIGDFNPNSEKFEIDLSSYSKGVYFVLCQSKEKSLKTIKITKQ